MSEWKQGYKNTALEKHKEARKAKNDNNDNSNLKIFCDICESKSC